MSDSCSPWSSASLTSTFGLKRVQDLPSPQPWDVPEHPGPAGCLSHASERVSAQTCSRATHFGQSQLRRVQGSTGRRLIATLPSAQRMDGSAHASLPSTLGKPGTFACPLPSSLHPILRRPQARHAVGGTCWRARSRDARETGGTSPSV